MYVHAMHVDPERVNWVNITRPSKLLAGGSAPCICQLWVNILNLYMWLYTKLPRLVQLYECVIACLGNY